MEILLETILELAKDLFPLIQIICTILIVWKLYDIHKVQSMIYKKISKDNNQETETPEN